MRAERARSALIVPDHFYTAAEVDALIRAAVRTANDHATLLYRDAVKQITEAMATGEVASYSRDKELAAAAERHAKGHAVHVGESPDPGLIE